MKNSLFVRFMASWLIPLLSFGVVFASAPYVSAAQKNNQYMQKDYPASNMVLVEGSTFTMGDTIGDGRDDEKPKHKITVSSFYIGKYEVTFSEYDAFCEATGSVRLGIDSEWNSEWGNEKDRDSLPVSVIWYNAIEYCNWRSLREGLTPVYKREQETSTASRRYGNIVYCDFSANGYRLPTEAEWEYAARGGVKSKGYKYSGSNDASLVGWYNGNAGKSIHPVGQKQPNELGLYDMSGNVWEWCWDRYEKYPEEGTVSQDPLVRNPFRVMRGGAWYSYDSAITVSSRNSFKSILGGNTIGFRLVRSCQTDSVSSK